MESVLGRWRKVEEAEGRWRKVEEGGGRCEYIRLPSSDRYQSSVTLPASSRPTCRTRFCFLASSAPPATPSPPHAPPRAPRAPRASGPGNQSNRKKVSSDRT